MVMSFLYKSTGNEGTGERSLFEKSSAKTLLKRKTNLNKFIFASAKISLILYRRQHHFAVGEFTSTVYCLLSTVPIISVVKFIVK